MSDVTLLTGAVWGLAGAVALVVVMKARGGDDPPPFAVFWANFIRDGDPADAMPQAILLHAVYATVAGAVYTSVFNPVGDSVGLAITAFTGGILWASCTLSFCSSGRWCSGAGWSSGWNPTGHES